MIKVNKIKLSSFNEYKGSVRFTESKDKPKYQDYYKYLLDLAREDAKKRKETPKSTQSKPYTKEVISPEHCYQCGKLLAYCLHNYSK